MKIQYVVANFPISFRFFSVDHFGLVFPFLTFRVKFYQTRKYSQIRKFPSKLKLCQPDRYWSLCYNKQEVTMNNLFRFFDYFYLKAQADIVVYN